MSTGSHMNTPLRILSEIGGALIVAGALTYWFRWSPERTLTVLTIIGGALWGSALLLWLFRA